jgi:hypothetical protein
MTAQPTAAFADGPVSIVGVDNVTLVFTVANTDRANSPGGAADWGFVNGNGLNWLASALTGVYTATTLTASRLTIPYATILTTFGIDVLATLVWEAWIPTATLSLTGTADVGVAFIGASGAPNNSANRMWACKRAFRGGINVAITTTSANTDSSNYTSAPGGTSDVVAVVKPPMGFAGCIGTVVGGVPWPSLDTIVTAGANGEVSLAAATGSNMGIGFASNGVLGTARARVGRLRLRRIYL